MDPTDPNKLLAELNDRMIGRAYGLAIVIVLIGVAMIVDGESGGPLVIGGGICLGIVGRELVKTGRRLSE